MRAGLVIAAALVAFGCGSGSPKPAKQSAPAPSAAAKVKITQFYTANAMIPRGMKGSLCYGVENAATVEINPEVEKLWPAPARCFEISPKAKTTYTLTAYGQDGSRETKSLDVSVGAPPPRLYDLWVNAVDVRKGQEVKICFKTENARSTKVTPGKLEPAGNCMTDRPSRTTTYRITAIGGDYEIDSGTVTVKVH